MCFLCWQCVNWISKFVSTFSKANLYFFSFFCFIEIDAREKKRTRADKMLLFTWHTFLYTFMMKYISWKWYGLKLANILLAIRSIKTEMASFLHFEDIKISPQKWWWSPLFLLMPHKAERAQRDVKMITTPMRSHSAYFLMPLLRWSICIQIRIQRTFSSSLTGVVNLEIPLS